MENKEIIFNIFVSLKEAAWLFIFISETGSYAIHGPPNVSFFFLLWNFLGAVEEKFIFTSSGFFSSKGKADFLHIMDNAYLWEMGTGAQIFPSLPCPDNNLYK